MTPSDKTYDDYAVIVPDDAGVSAYSPRANEVKIRAMVKSLIAEEDQKKLSSLDDDPEEEDDLEEFSVSSGVAGFTVPLGMGTASHRKKKRDDAISANARAFGGAKIYNK